MLFVCQIVSPVDLATKALELRYSIPNCDCLKYLNIFGKNKIFY